MNRVEHLLTILGEECSELHQEACKVQRFGYDEGKQTRLQKEFNDIIAMVEMLADEGIHITFQEDLIRAKKAKVEHFLFESIELGTLEE